MSDEEKIPCDSHDDFQPTCGACMELNPVTVSGDPCEFHASEEGGAAFQETCGACVEGNDPARKEMEEEKVSDSVGEKVEAGAKKKKRR